MQTPGPCETIYSIAPNSENVFFICSVEVDDGYFETKSVLSAGIELLFINI